MPTSDAVPKAEAGAEVREGLMPCYAIYFPGGSDGKESACSAGDLVLIPGSGKFPGEGDLLHSSTLALRIPWTEEPGGLQSMRSQRIRND